MQVRRAFLANSGIPCEFRDHPEVDLVVLYIVVYPIARIHYRLSRFPSHLPSPARSSMPGSFSLCSWPSLVMGATLPRFPAVQAPWARTPPPTSQLSPARRAPSLPLQSCLLHATGAPVPLGQPQPRLVAAPLASQQSWSRLPILASPVSPGPTFPLHGRAPLFPSANSNFPCHADPTQ